MDNPSSNQLQPITSKTPLINILTGGSRSEVVSHLALYKDRGVVSYNKVLHIPFNQRIPELIKQDGGRATVLTALVASIGSAVKNIQVKNGMNEEQIVTLADMIIDQSHEDYIGIEDVLLFLQGLLLGKYGKLYERFDIPIFFEKLEQYRQERHEEVLRVREERNAQYKILGKDNIRRTDHSTADGDTGTLFDLMQTYNEEKNGDSDNH